jgi:PAS domain S-box-containing protein
MTVRAQHASLPELAPVPMSNHTTILRDSITVAFIHAADHDAALRYASFLRETGVDVRPLSTGDSTSLRELLRSGLTGGKDPACLLMHDDDALIIEAFTALATELASACVICVRDEWKESTMSRLLALGAHDCIKTRDSIRLQIALRNAVRLHGNGREKRVPGATIPQHDPNPVVQVTPEGSILYANPASALLLRCWDVNDGKLPGEWTEVVQTVYANGEVYQTDAWCADRLFHLSIAPLTASGSIILFAHDISERIHAERKLRESEQLFRMAFRTSPDAMSIVRLVDGAYVDVNEGFCTITGYSREEVIGHSSLDPGIWFDDNEQWRMNTQLRNHGFVRNFEARFRTKTGAAIDGLVSASVIFINDIPHVLSVTRDISELKKAADAIRTNEQRYRGIFENTGTATVLFGDDGIITMCNDNFASLAGCSSGDILGKRHWKTFVHPDDISFMLEYHSRRKKESDVPTRYEFRFLTVKGQIRHIFMQIGLIPGTEHRVASLLDITEMKHAAQSLRESEERYRSLQDNLPIGLFRSTPDGTFLYVNPAFVAMFGYASEDELYDTPVQSFYVDAGERRVLLERIRNGEVITEYDIQYVHRDGHPLWCRLSVRGYYDDDGMLMHIDGIVIDVSERHAAEEERRKLHDAIHQSPSSIVITDADGLVEFANPAFFVMTGRDSESVVSHRLPLLDDISRQDDISAAVWEAMQAGSEWRGEIQGRRADGTPFWEAYTLKGVLNARGSFTHIIAVSHDVSERKTIEQQLIVAKEKAEEASRIKSTFLATMSHELRTPLNGILGFANLLEEDVNELSHKEMAGIIVNSGNRLLDTLNSILDLSVVEADKLNINWEHVQLADILRDVHRLYEITATRKGLELEVLTPHEGMLIVSDARLIRQILNNLVNNAIKYTMRGSVTMTLEAVEHDERPYVAIHVEDTGIGISKENQALIFEEFRQVSEGYGRAYEGSGLGLSVSRKFALALGGEITLHSTGGSGSCFTLLLPRRDRQSDNAVQPSELSAFAVDGRSFSILLVEDDAASRQYIHSILSPLLDIQCAGSADEAIELASSKRYDAILMDINLGSGKSGLDAARHIRHMEAYRHIPIAAVTAHAMPEHRDDFLSDACTHFLAKPFTRTSLLQLLNEMLTTAGKNT